MANLTVWQPYSFLKDNYSHRFAVIKLNTPFYCQKSLKLFESLWRRATLRACTDGAANILYDCVDVVKLNCLPNIISGDFDSARPEVLQFFRDKGVSVIDTPDQNFTDFTKCLKLLTDKIKEENLQISEIIVHVSNDDRLDHTMANINTLYKGREMTTVPIYLIFQNAVSFLLPKGKNVIHTSSTFRDAWCSLVPIGIPCHHVTTTGLKYNLDGQGMRFGDLISTSNAFEDSISEVSVETDEPLLWASGIHL